MMQMFQNDFLRLSKWPRRKVTKKRVHQVMYCVIIHVNGVSSEIVVLCGFH